MRRFFALLALVLSAAPAAAWLTTSGAGRSTSGVGGSWSDTYPTVAFGGTSTGWSGYTVRILIPASQLTTSGTQVRVTIASHTSGDGVIGGKAYVCHKAGAGDAYDCAGAPAQMLSSGGAGFSIGTSATHTFDATTFALNEATDVIAIFYFGGNTDIPYDPDNGGAVNSYYILGDDASTQNTTGYSATGSNPDATFLVQRIEVFN